MKKLILVLITLILFGCQTSPRQLWGATINKDEFTDKITKMVTVGEGLSGSVIITQSLKYYPFVGIQNDELHVGIRSGGRYRIPTGTVQIRVDENQAWTIGSEETPLYLLTEQPKFATGVDSSTDLGRMIEKTQGQVMANAARISSPYTATTGEKAKKILKEMLSGKIVRYRTVGITQASSTTGEVKIDESFVRSLREIGINPEDL